MKFSMSHKFGGDPVVFSDEDAPDWLTSKHTIKGSTMDMRWFWTDCVLKLEVGRSVETEFRTITRVE